MTTDPISRFYQEHLPGAVLDNTVLRAPCPFCAARIAKAEQAAAQAAARAAREDDEDDYAAPLPEAQAGPPPPAEPGEVVVILSPDSYFHGYFRCSRRCTPGGFPLHFARLMGLPLSGAPGFEPDREYAGHEVQYPSLHLNQEMEEFVERLGEDQEALFRREGVLPETLREVRVGYNGRYLVYPYYQANGNCYAARCVHPDHEEDSFWHGDEAFFGPEFQVFNAQDIDRAENGALFVAEGERNLLIIKQLGFPGIAVPEAAALEALNPLRLQWVRHIFLVMRNSVESAAAARTFATRCGFKVRILRWPDGTPRDMDLHLLAAESPAAAGKQVAAMIREARAFSPFPSPELEFHRFRERLTREGGEEYRKLARGFPKLDAAIGGIHGINILGGTPKAGKSTFFIQAASDMALRGIPVIYYDFENGRQKIYMRILSRLARLRTEQIRSGALSAEERERLAAASRRLEQSLRWLRVVNDRKLSPEIMRRHIDFIRHETRSDYAVVVVDSLHKLPFKDISQKRSGIDGWLRQLEAIRDELGAGFLVISELERKDGQFEQHPQLGSFKGSGDIGYSADNAMVLSTQWDPFADEEPDTRVNELWLVASREHPPGRVAEYRLDYPFWGFVEG